MLWARVGRACGARLGQTGVPQGRRDPPPQQPVSPSPGPQLRVCKSLVCMGSGPGAGALPGGVAGGPRPAPRAHLGSVAILAVQSAARAGAAERATAAATAPAAASTAAAAAAGGGRKETLAFQGARLGQSRGAWGGAGFGPGWGRMVNLEPMHTGEGRRE